VEQKTAGQRDMNDTTRKWEELLNPDVLRTKLVTASTYPAAFERLRDSIIKRVERL
jgi:hypothetical protein